MYVIIVGAEVGYHLAKALIKEGHEVLVIDKEAEPLSRIEDELGSICSQGDGCDISVLREAGAERTDLLVALTSADEDNLVACQIAKHKFNVPRTIARVSNPQNEALFRKVGIDVTVSSVKLILENITESILTHSLTHLLSLEDSNVQMVEARILPASPVAGKRLRDAVLPAGSLVILMIRNGAAGGSDFLVPAPDTLLQIDDRLIVVVKKEQEEALLAAFVTG